MNDELEDFMYTETLQCISAIDENLPEYNSVDGITFITYCSESMADVSQSVGHGYSIDTVYKLAGTILDRYRIVADSGLDQYALSFQLYSNTLKKTREGQFESWVNGWELRCADHDSDQTGLDVEILGNTIENLFI